MYKNYGRWRNFDCIFGFSVKSYVRNTINISYDKILLNNVIGKGRVTHVSKQYFTQNTAVLQNISSCANDINCRKYPYTKRMITVNQACRQYCNFSLNKPHADSRITKWLCKRNPLLRQKPFWWHLGSNKQACKLFLRVVCCNSEIRDLQYSRLKIVE